MGKIISIHQANFFPWYPFFEKMMASDIFVIMVHCQFEKNNYQNRFLYNDQWLTMRVKGGTKSILEKEYIDPLNDWNRIKKSFPKKDLSIFDDCFRSSVGITNIKIIQKIADILDIKTQIVVDYSTNLKGTDRLVDLCRHYEADTYLSGPSGRNYLQLDKFEDIRIKFHENNIKQPILCSIEL